MSAPEARLDEIRYSRDVRPFGAISIAVSVATAICVQLASAGPSWFLGNHVLFVFLASAAVALPLALSLAEITSRGSRDPAMLDARLQGPDAGAYGVSWVLLGGTVITAALLAKGAASFLATLALHLFGTGIDAAWIAPVAVALIVAGNILGAHAHRTVQNLLTIVFVAIVLALALSGSTMGWGTYLASGGDGHGMDIASVAAVSGVFWGLFFIFFSANDIRDPAHSAPRTILIALPLIAGICTAGVLAAPFFATLDGGDLVRLARLIHGTAWTHLAPAVALVTAAAFLVAMNRAVLAATFVAADMSRRGFIPSEWRKPHPTLLTPYRLLAGLGAAVALISAVLTPVQALAAASLAFLIAAIAVNIPSVINRHGAATNTPPFKLPFAPLVPGLAIVISVFLITTFDALYLAAAGIWGFIGAVTYLLYGRHAAAKAMEGITVFRDTKDQRAHRDYRVLVPISNPATASALLRAASLLAESQSGEVIALHVVTVPHQTTLSSGRRLGRLRWQSLEQAIDQAETPEVPIHSLVRFARSPVQGILDTAIEEDCSLILLGWTGVSDRGAAVGPVIDDVVNLAMCDVALLRGELGDECENILVPTGGGPHAPVALRLGTQLAQSLHSSITLLTFITDDSRHDSTDASQAVIDRTCEAASSDFPVETSIVPTDDIQQALLNRAEGFDLIIMGASQQGPIDQVVFGGLPESVARHSKSPVILVRRHRSLPQRWLHRLWLRTNAVLPSLTKQQIIEVYRSIRRDSRPDIDFFILILLSAIIATFGLLQGSTAVIIGAMLVAPLMTPILGISMGIVRGDVRLLFLAAESALKGVFLAVLVSIGVVLVTPGAAATPEILARTQPTLLDLFVALASGAAGAYAIGRKDVAAALPGVAIAAALVPPLCVIGVGITLSQADVAVGAMLLFGANLIAITMAGAVVFLLLGLRPEPDEEDRQRRLWQGLAVTLALVITISIPLAWLLVKSIRDQNQTAGTREVLVEVGASFQASLVDLEIKSMVNPRSLEVTATYYAAEPPPASLVTSAEEVLSEKFKADVDLQVQVIPIAIVRGE
jgi:uncharacterized hydrophobic protein (TIGR00271 family)